MAAPGIAYAVRYSVELVALPIGAGPMGVPDQQRIKINQSSPGASGTIAVTSTGAYPTSTNITNAMTTLGTNAAAALNNAAATSVWQGWNAGGG